MATAGTPTHYDQDSIAALSVLLNQSAQMTEELGDDAIVDEVSLRTGNKFRIVSRPFRVADVNLILVAILANHLPYRDITTQAVQKIKDLF